MFYLKKICIQIYNIIREFSRPKMEPRILFSPFDLAVITTNCKLNEPKKMSQFIVNLCRANPIHCYMAIYFYKFNKDKLYVI